MSEKKPFCNAKLSLQEGSKFSNQSGYDGQDLAPSIMFLLVEIQGAILSSLFFISRRNNNLYVGI